MKSEEKVFWIILASFIIGTSFGFHGGKSFEKTSKESQLLNLKIEKTELSIERLKKELK